MHPLELALRVVLFHSGRGLGGSRSERLHHAARRHHNGRNLTPESFRKDGGHFYAIQDFGREEIVLSGVRCRAVGKHLCRNCGQILAGDPADPLIPHGPTQLALREPEGGKDILHEEMRMQVCPCDAAAFDVALHHLVPCKVWIGRPTVPKNALMDDEAHA